MKLPTLYGVSSNGTIKEWSVHTEGSTIVVRHGKHGGKIQEKRSTAKAKNVGRSNETTCEQQAELEAQSKWNKQKDKSYYEDIDNIKPMLNPMLAHDYRKQGHRIKYPAYAQPKLDGVRCLVYLEDDVIKFKSRGGKEYPALPHLVEQLEEIFSYHSGLVLDGELYVHEMALQDIVSLVKKPKEGSEKVSFWVFDLAHEENIWEHRLLWLQNNLHLMDNTHVQLLRHYKVTSEDHLLELHDEYVSLGFEGVMVRNSDGLYKFDHRSADLQKYKVFQDSEYKIIEVVQDKDGRGVFVCITEDDQRFSVTLKSTHEQRQEVWDNRYNYTGKMLTVQYQALTKDNIPQFPVGIVVRDYE